MFSFLKFKCTFFLIFLCNTISFGAKIPEDISSVLMKAGNNRIELQNVINHYNSKDALKLKAAYFLIRNMPPHYGIYYDMKNPSDYKMVLDIRKISAALLIENIDYAFKAWKFPWSEHLTFDEFCEYILPYRFDNEKLESWRPEFMKKYAWLTDSMKNNTDPLKACEFISREIGTWFRYNERKISPGTKGPSMLLTEKGGMCTEEAAIVNFAMRSMGIPVTHETIPYWGYTNMGHDFNTVLSKTGEFLPFTATIFNITHPYTIPRVPKVYRKNYAIKFELQASPDKNVTVSPFGLDVTNKYVKITDIKISITGIPLNRLKSTYLCVFNNNAWVPVSTGSLIANELCFKNLGRNMVYLPISEVNGESFQLQAPIQIDRDGNIIILNPTSANNDSEMQLRRKALNNVNEIKGGRFQASDNKNFEHPIEIHLIDYPSKMTYEIINVNLDKPFRYWRLIYPDSSFTSVDISEIEFYEKNKVTGCPISISNETIKEKTTQQHENDVKDNPLMLAYVEQSKNEINAQLPLAFDQDTSSYITLTSSMANWVGIDFGKPKKIKTIRFYPRNYYSYSKAEEQSYELFYWRDDNWLSLGKKNSGAVYTLKYENAPQNALFLLKNLTRGTQERIFTYKNGERIWQ